MKIKPVRVGILGGDYPLVTAAFEFRLLKGWYRFMPPLTKQEFPSIISFNATLNSADWSQPGGRGEFLERLGDTIRLFEENGCRFLFVPCNRLQVLSKEIRTFTSMRTVDTLSATVDRLKRRYFDRKDLVVKVLAPGDGPEGALYEAALREAGLQVEELSGVAKYKLEEAAFDIRLKGPLDSIGERLQKDLLADGEFARNKTVSLIANNELTLVRHQLSQLRVEDTMVELVYACAKALGEYQLS